MEQVFFRLHVRSHRYITRVFPPKVRQASELVVLGSALCLVSLLVVLHVSHVLPHDGGCIRGLVPEMRGGASLPFDVLRVRIVPPEQNELTEAFSRVSEAVRGQLTSLPPAKDGRATTCAPADSHRASGANGGVCGGGGGSSSGSGSGDDAYGDRSEGQTRTFYFALEKGWLLVSPEERARHRVVERTVEVSGELYKACMAPLTHAAENRSRTGNARKAPPSRSSVVSLVLRGMLETFLGYETVVMHALIGLSEGRGFVSVRGPFSSEIVDLGAAAEYSLVAGGTRGGGKTSGARGGDEETDGRYDASRIGKLIGYKLGVIFTALFLFFVTTPLVSFTLRETQERMLKFTFLLHHHVRHRQSYVALIAAHMVDTLVYIPIMVGMVFFLFEFFDDQLLAFVVLSVVWICEVYSAISVRTPQSIRFFPRFYFIYFLAFHIYFFSYPFGGFSHLAVLAVFVLPMVHAMVHFWNRFEAPALSEGAVTALHPRGMPVLPIFPRWSLPANGNAGVDFDDDIPGPRQQDSPPPLSPPPGEGARPSTGVGARATVPVPQRPALDLSSSNGGSRGGGAFTEVATGVGRP